ncbi:type II secretion system F family protein [Flavobacteriaceae bacterium]|nr:type II secretion system F family protein [Flavobacteriaceae bacterium]
MTFFGRSFSNKIKEDFYTELSVLLKAGITLKDGLELIENTLKKKKPKKILQELSQAIVAGSSLSAAIKSHKEFSDYEYFSLKIGEETGTLVQVSEQLGAFFIRKNEQRRQEALKAAEPENAYLAAPELEQKIRDTRKLMESAAKDLDFLHAAQFRDQIKDYQKKLEALKV